MDSEEEDVIKLTQFIDQQKSNYRNNFQLEFQDFISFKRDPGDQEFDEEELLHEEEIIESEEDDVKHFKLQELPAQVSATTLTEDEKSVIDSCNDKDLKRLLVLNRSKNMQLIKLHKKVREMLMECEKALHEKDLVIKNLESKQMSQQTYLWKLAAPYFKDKKFYPCTLNEDTTKKRSRNELSVYDLFPSPKWTTVEIDRLINAVKCNYNVNRQNDLVQRINALKSEPEEGDDKTKLKEIMSLEEELEIVKKDDKIPSLNSNEFINWYKVAETFLKDKHTAVECQSVWHMLVHPDINKSEWTNEENKSLKAIAKRHSYQNWDDIAAELDTKRTGFTTCLHYFSKLCDKFKKSKFTEKEDKFLLEVVDIYKVGNFIPWNKVVCHFNNRSRHQLYHRYTYFLSQNHVKKGKFTEAEDVLLMILVKKFGRNFKKCAEYMPHRSQIQLKSRYNSNLQRRIKKGTFTVEDDQIIYDHVQKYGEKGWSRLTEKLRRCNAQIRQRYKLIKSFMAANPDSDLKNIPKRKHHLEKYNDDQYSFLSYMADQFKDADDIPTISMIEESLQVELKTPNTCQSKKKKTRSNLTGKKVKSIDSMLTDFFCSSMKIKQNNDPNEINIVEASNNVEEILSLLGANLSLPNNFECNIHLDTIDVQILDKISQKQINCDSQKLDKLVTPNINTLVGLRGLIIKHKDYKIQQKSKYSPGTSKGDVIWFMEQNLLKLDEKSREEVLFHRDLFTKRFDALFKWSAIMSLEKPNQFNVPNSLSINEKPMKSPVKCNVRKAIDRNDHDVVAKKRKIDRNTLTNVKGKLNIKNSQLQLVDKSVVEKLMKNGNNINIIKIKTVTDSSGIVRPLIQQNSEESITQPTLTNSLGNEDQEVEKSRQDVQKLNVTLKSELVNSDSTECTNEEYQAIKDDVQLLKEILHYEKIKIKPDPDDF